MRNTPADRLAVRLAAISSRASRASTLIWVAGRAFRAERLALRFREPPLRNRFHSMGVFLFEIRVGSRGLSSCHYPGSVSRDGKRPGLPKKVAPTREQGWKWFRRKGLLQNPSIPGLAGYGVLGQP